MGLGISSLAAHRNTQSIQTRALADIGWKWLATSTIVGFCAAYLASYLMRPAYRAETVIVPASQTGKESVLAGISSQLGGLGALGGLGSYGDPEKIEFVETLRSSGMARKFLEEEGLVSVLCAAHVASCVSGTKNLMESNENAALRAFVRHILNVSDDKRTGVVRVTITWIDRKQSASWANDFVALANRELQRRAVTEARQRVVFLERAAAATDIQELRGAIYRLMESEVKMEMLASTRPDYAFRVIDFAAVPDERDKVRPLRSVIGLLGAVAAFAVAYAAAFGFGYSRQSRRLNPK